MIKQVLRSVATETAPHRFIADASDVGLKPGEWPMRLTTDIGNGQDLLRRPFIRSDGSAIYDQEFGCCALHILND